MSDRLPSIIATYLEAYNARDRKAALACFSENAVVHDEGQVHRGRQAIDAWIDTTTEKYQPILSAGEVGTSDSETVVATSVSGSFPGSPVRLSFRFTLGEDGIAGLAIVP